MSDEYAKRIRPDGSYFYGREIETGHSPRPLDEPAGSVDRLKQYVTSAWVEAEAVCVDAQTTGPSEVMMIFKARDMLRDVLHVLNSCPPNDQSQRPADTEK